MNFDWTNFTENDFVDYCARVENGMVYGDDYHGCVRIGDLCFDLVTRSHEKGKLWLSYDLYVGGVDTGYGYSDDYPYDYAEGGDFEDCMINLSYDDFKKTAEEHFKVFINTWPYNKADLVAKANKPLNIW